jgi:hypothetical protein
MSTMAIAHLLGLVHVVSVGVGLGVGSLATQLFRRRPFGEFTGEAARDGVPSLARSSCSRRMIYRKTKRSHNGHKQGEGES